MLVFDIETGPLPEEELKAIYQPLDESTIEGVVTGDFDPNSVKVGNLKDPWKIQKKIDQARANHESAKANSANVIAAAKRQHWQEFVERAALSAITGRVLAVGYLATESGKHAIDDGNGNECEMLANFWGKYSKCRSAGRKMVGHNCLSFDIPFLVRRSWLLDVEVPSTLLDKLKWLDPIFVDTMALWGCGGRDPVKLDLLGQAFRVGQKTEGVSGADFHKLWFGTPEDRELALEYLTQDLRLTAAVAQKMCLI
jgi:hypothetical protein